MISDKKLKILSLSACLVGIVIIFIVASLSVNQVLIRDVSVSEVGRHVILNGMITDYSTSNGNVFLSLTDETGEIKVVVFERTARNQDVYNLKKSDVVVIKGQINVYKDELEIIANSIELKNS